MKTKINKDWFNAKELLPEKSGQYLVFGISSKGAVPTQRVARFHKGNEYNKSEWLTHYPYMTILYWSYLKENPK